MTAPRKPRHSSRLPPKKTERSERIERARQREELDDDDDAPILCETCPRTCHGGMRAPCHVRGCDCYCNRNNR